MWIIQHKEQSSQKYIKTTIRRTERKYQIISWLLLSLSQTDFISSSWVNVSCASGTRRYVPFLYCTI